MTRISVLEARQHLATLARRVEAGEDIIITLRGKDLVRLAPVTPPLPDLSHFRASLPSLVPADESFSEVAAALRDDDL